MVGFSERWFDRCLEVRSDPDFYDKELLGEKPNTVRLVTPCEYAAMRVCNTIKVILRPSPDVFFEREITDISKIGVLVGKVLVVISWRHE